jgi:Tfp pilus assembly PilM family ATPase
MKWITEQQVKLKKIMDSNWKQTLNVGPLDVFGLDIGTSAVKIVQLRKERR